MTRLSGQEEPGWIKYKQARASDGTTYLTTHCRRVGGCAL